MERPLRLEGIDPERAYTAKEIKTLKQEGKRSETAPPVIKKVHKRAVDADPLRGLFAARVKGKPAVVEYEPDTDLRDTEQVPLMEEGGIEAFLSSRGAALCSRRLVRAEQGQNWLRNQLHPPLLQAPASASTRGDSFRNFGPGAGD